MKNFLFKAYKKGLFDIKFRLEISFSFSSLFVFDNGTTIFFCMVFIIIFTTISPAVIISEKIAEEFYNRRSKTKHKCQKYYNWKKIGF